MEPLSMALIGGSVVSSLAGMFGGNKGSKYIDQAIQELIKVKVPDPEMQKLALERYRTAGELAPELEHAIKSDPSAFESVIQNQKYSQAQDQALGQLQSLGEEGGMSLTDKADLQEQMIANANKDKANRDAITDDMARRGQGGSGMAMQAQLAGAQTAGDRDASSRLRTMGTAQDRALDAIMGAGDLAGNLQGQDFERQSAVASARDRINQFNTENSRDVQQRNIASRNAAAASNLDRKQQMMNDNTDLANREQQYNKELYQKQFDNQTQKSGAMANAYTGAATQANQADAQKRQTYGAIGSGLGQIGTTINNQNNWDEWMKKTKGVK